LIIGIIVSFLPWIIKTQVFMYFNKSIFGKRSLLCVFFIFGSNILRPEAKEECKMIPPTGVFLYDPKYTDGPDPKDSPYLDKY
jgi:hypothetical protein